ncbi:DUF1501 domain-containing protein [Engelhardtia mirabilis]|uniref:Uncharacterized protein n=1 Tax=Engelhardtia mirabilis TaxID=2528011 RepID=A0A518BNR4_9BACT|nr:hypothetical protein Pla133_36820 [Planctomycetes bacterium Pla133]QDV02908.1 hypothetical protein Pla86_36800 [Planctomycetes bacterium Pla86]
MTGQVRDPGSGARGTTRREFLVGSALVTGGLGLPSIPVAEPEAVVFVLVERGLPACDLVAGHAPVRVTSGAALDGWGGVSRELVAAPAFGPFHGRLSACLPRLAARDGLELSTGLDAAATDWFEAARALESECVGVRAIGRTFADRCREARELRRVGELALTVRETADWGRPRGFQRCAEALDRGLEELFAGLANDGLLDSTLVVVCSAIGRSSYGRLLGGRECQRRDALALGVGPGARAAMACRTTIELARGTLGRLGRA